MEKIKSRRFSPSNFKLRTQLLMSFGIILIISIGVLSGYSISKTRTQLIDQNTDRLVDMRNTAVSVAIGTLENELNLVHSWASNPSVKDTATLGSSLDPVNDLWNRYEGTKWGDSNDPLASGVTEKTELIIDYSNDINPDVSEWMTDLLTDFAYAELFFTDARGYAIASTGNTGDFAQADEGWWINAVSDGLFISDFEFDDSSSSWSISISIAIQSSNFTLTNGPVAGVVKAQYNFESLIVELEESVVKELKNYIFIIYSQSVDQIIYRSDSNAAAESFSEAFLGGKTNEKLISADSFDGQVKLDSESYYVSKNQLVLDDEWPLQWNFLAGIKESVVSDLVYEQIINTVILGVVSLVILIMASFFISKMLAQRLKDIQERANEVANGNLTVTVVSSEGSKDEIADLANNFNSMTQKLKSLVLDISELSAHTASTAENLASSAEEVSASVEEISSTTHSMSRGATQQAEMIAQMVQNVNQAGTMIEDIIEQIQNNTTLVGEIAQETKYLALNARIEAARAGASGRGFSVVAEDVKNLSEQSRATAEEVAKIVESISHSLGTFFDELKEQIETIAAVSEETAASAEEVSAATEEMSATMEEIASSSDEMTSYSIIANEKIMSFKIEK